MVILMAARNNNAPNQPYGTKIIICSSGPQFFKADLFPFGAVLSCRRNPRICCSIAKFFLAVYPPGGAPAAVFPARMRQSSY
jgi:hypothetical protein